MKPRNAYGRSPRPGEPRGHPGQDLHEGGEGLQHGAHVAAAPAPFSTLRILVFILKTNAAFTKLNGADMCTNLHCGSRVLTPPEIPSSSGSASWSSVPISSGSSPGSPRWKRERGALRARRQHEGIGWGENKTAPGHAGSLVVIYAPPTGSPAPAAGAPGLRIDLGALGFPAEEKTDETVKSVLPSAHQNSCLGYLQCR